MLTLSGSELAKEIKADIDYRIKEYLKEGKRPPCLVTILVGDDPASKVYVSNKEKACNSTSLSSYYLSLSSISCRILSMFRENLISAQ